MNDDNTDNANDDPITNIDNSQEIIINISDKDENLHSSVLVNLPLMKILLHLQVFRTKSVIITKHMIEMKNFMMQEIFNITQIIKNIKQANCRDEVKHLREENNSKNEIIKILLEKIPSIAISTNAQVQSREVMQTSNSSNDML